jgi:hypothetical protein
MGNEKFLPPFRETLMVSEWGSWGGFLLHVMQHVEDRVCVIPELKGPNLSVSGYMLWTETRATFKKRTSFLPTKTATDFRSVLPRFWMLFSRRQDDGVGLLGEKKRGTGGFYSRILSRNTSSSRCVVWFLHSHLRKPYETFCCLPLVLLFLQLRDVADTQHATLNGLAGVWRTMKLLTRQPT